MLLTERRGEGGGDAAELRGAEVHGRRRQRDDGVPDEPERLRGRRGGSDLAHLPISVIHLDIDSTVVGTRKDGV